MGMCQSSPSIRLITLGSVSTVLIEASSTTWKNTSAGSGVLCDAAFANSLALKVLLLSMCSTINHLI
jgi:hypothetical protein